MFFEGFVNVFNLEIPFESFYESSQQPSERKLRNITDTLKITPSIKLFNTCNYKYIFMRYFLTVAFRFRILISDHGKFHFFSIPICVASVPVLLRARSP